VQRISPERPFGNEKPANLKPSIRCTPIQQSSGGQTRLLQMQLLLRQQLFAPIAMEPLQCSAFARTSRSITAKTVHSPPHFHCGLPQQK
jgi:hypothetical protein